MTPKSDIAGGLFSIIVIFGLIKLFFWFCFGGGFADISTGPPPDTLSDEDLKAMGMHRWVKRRNRSRRNKL